jgi:ribokinase
VALVDRKPDYTTGTALIMIDAQGHNYLSVAPGANYTITAERIRSVKDRIAAAAMVLVQYEIPRDALVEILTIAGKAGVPRVFNFAPARDFSFDAATIPEYLIVNEVEFQQLFGADPEGLLPKPASAGAASANPAKAGPASAGPSQPQPGPSPELLPLAKDFPLVIVTLGAAGVGVFRRGVPGESYAAFPAKPVDTTGAGDTFCGAFTVAISEGKDLSAAIRFGQGAAALSVQVFGALPSVPYRKDIDRFLEAQS